MFIRWQSRKLQSRYGRKANTRWSAILAESERIDGQPRQRHIAYLGSITAQYIEVVQHRCYFWDHIDAAFKKLGRKVKPAERQRLEATIAIRVPRPTAAEYKAAAHEAARKWGWEFLSKGFKAVLADEADKWKGHEGEGFAEINQALSGTSGTVTCSFCGRDDKAVKVMVKGARAAICNDCVIEATAAVAKHEAAKSA